MLWLYIEFTEAGHNPDAEFAFVSFDAVCGLKTNKAISIFNRNSSVSDVKKLGDQTLEVATMHIRLSKRWFRWTVNAILEAFHLSENLVIPVVLTSKINSRDSDLSSKNFFNQCLTWGL